MTPTLQLERRETLRSTWLIQGHIKDDDEESGWAAAMSSELRPWLHPGLSRLWGGWCGCHCACTWPKRVGEQSTQRFPWGTLFKGP